MHRRKHIFLHTSSIKLTNRLITKLAFVCFTRSSLSTLKTVVDISEIPSHNKFLKLNKTVKYQNKPMLIEEFFNAGIFDFQQLLDSDGNIKSYEDLLIDFELTPNNYSLIKQVKLILAVPLSWLHEQCRCSLTLFPPQILSGAPLLSFR